jgi:flagellin
MRINTNVASINAQKNLWNTQQAQSRSMDKLSSGFRINRAGDDAAGLGIANQLRADNRSLQQAFRNAEQGNSVLQIAEGSTSTIQKMLERMKELATQAASDTVDGDADKGGRARLNNEFNELRDEIDRIVSSTQFQGTKLLDGFAQRPDLPDRLEPREREPALGLSFGNLTLRNARACAPRARQGTGGTCRHRSTPDGDVTAGMVTGTFTGTTNATIEFTSVDDGADGFSFQYSIDGGTAQDVGQVGDDFVLVHQGVTINLGDTRADQCGLRRYGVDDRRGRLATAATWRVQLVSLGSRDDALTAMEAIDEALGTLNEELGNIGAYQNRLEYTMANLKTSIQNNAAAESVIRDLDMAEEMTNFSKLGILSQAGQAMLAQANQSTQGVLQLLRG